MVLTQDTGLSLSADSVMVAITALPEMAQLSLDHVRKDITAHMETRLHNLSHRLQVNKHIYYEHTACTHIQEGLMVAHFLPIAEKAGLSV